MNKHDPTNKECRQNKECTHGWRTEPCPKCTCPAQKEECPACNGDIHAKFTVVADFPLLCEKHKNQIDGHLAEIANTPAQKEDPFSDFMKSQGINVVDVTPTQKEEWVEEYDELPSSFYRAPSHRDDCEGLVAGDIGLPCTCTTQKEECEEWEEDFRASYGNILSEETIEKSVDYWKELIQSTRADERAKLVKVVKGMERHSWDSGIYNKALEDVLAKISKVWHLNRH